MRRSTDDSDDVLPPGKIVVSVQCIQLSTRALGVHSFLCVLCACEFFEIFVRVHVLTCIRSVAQVTVSLYYQHEELKITKKNVHPVHE